MRFLARKSIPFTAGVLHSGDVDCCVAKTCAVECIVERAFERIGPDKLERCKKIVEGKTVIDSAFPVGVLNEPNLEIFEVADRIVSFREEREFKKLSCRDAIFVKSTQELLRCLEELRLLPSSRS